MFSAADKLSLAMRRLHDERDAIIADQSREVMRKR
jgi:hypothetical protein